jgi:LuxR family transcriptional regulator, maltose regulon positive regulatory protein
MPVLHRTMISRPRLLDVMADRINRSVTVITAGAGFGKSTLLAQAIHDPMMSGLAHIVFHRLGSRDHDASRLTESLTRQIGELAASLVAAGDEHPLRLDRFAPDVSVADQLWHLSPVRVSVMIDDLHHLPPGASGWTVINDLIGDLPDNADLVFSGRGPHELKLARLIARGEAVDITESMLAFTDDELDEFASNRGVDRSHLDDHGWPALVELEASAGLAGAHSFVAQEVLDRLDPGRVAALRRLAVVDVIDAEIAAEIAAVHVTGAGAAEPPEPQGGVASMTPGELLAGLPLTTALDDGTWVMHDLWREVLTAALPDAERRVVASRVSAVLRRRGQLRDALVAAVAGDDRDAGVQTLVEFARDLPLRHSIADRQAVIDLLPPTLSSTAEAELLRADVAYATEPMAAAEPLQRSIDAATAQNRPEVTVLALLRLGDLAYRSGDRAGLRDARTRLGRLADLGGTGAEAGLALTDAWLLMLDNASEAALDAMKSPALPRYRPVSSMVDYYRAVQLGHAGRCDASLAALDDLRRTPDARILERLGGFGTLMTWWTGRLQVAGRAATLQLLDRLGADRQVHLYVEAAATAALFHASAGEVTAARSLIERATAQASRVPDTAWGVIAIQLATAAVELIDGDEAAAAARLERVVPESGPFDGVARHVFGNAGAMIYALVPRARPFFDAETVGPDLAVATRVGSALVSLREHGSTDGAVRLPWDDLPRLRTWAYEPHLAELAVAAISAGSIRARTALQALLHDPRRALRGVAARHDGPVGQLAATELAETPHRPADTVRVGVLGPTIITFGDEPVDSAIPIKRKMVRELLLLLVMRRSVRRDEAAAAIWPDKDENAARNNLRATLNHLRQLLESDGSDDSSPPWHIRSDGESLTLFASDRLIVDSDLFIASIDAARSADRDRRAADALEAYRHAVELYRGPFLDDALDQDWAFNQRTTFHLDFVDAATRASELASGRGDTDAAIGFARRAVDAEELSERAHRALIRALTASGDRAAARRAFDRVCAVLAADGLEPDGDTLRLGAQLGAPVTRS